MNTPDARAPARSRPWGSVALAGLLLPIWLVACAGGGGAGMSAAAPPPPTPDVSAVMAADPGSALAPNWQHGAFMEIFVRSYRDSDGDGSGDLRGLIQELPYLQQLGVRGLWLMPVTASADHDHGYAVANYRDTEPSYGTLADLDSLLTQAHKAGIGVVLDYVMNHSASTNPVFENSAYATTNPYRDWYVWLSADPGGWSIFGADPWHTVSTGAYFGAFSPVMPDWNLANQAVVSYHQSNLRFWLNRGVDGFRFDAVGNLFENGPSLWSDQPQDYVLMMQIRALVNTYQQRYLVCEDPGNPQVAGGAGGCGSAFAFDLRPHLLGAASNQVADIQAVAAYFSTAPAGMAPMLANHDSFTGGRVWDQLGGDQKKYRLAAASYLLAPGTPFIYYGEEIGMAGAADLTGDAAARTPMSWTSSTANAGFTTSVPYRSLSANLATQNVAAEESDPNSLLNFYRAMLALRNGRVSLRDGAYAQPQVSGSMLSYQRRSPGETTLVLINYGTASASAALAGLGANATLAAKYPAGSPDASADAGGDATVAIGAQSLLVFDVSPAL
jgi:alpha-amylase